MQAGGYDQSPGDIPGQKPSLPHTDTPPIAAFCVQQGEDIGQLLHLSDYEVDKLNFEVLAAATNRSASFFIPAEQPFELLFFRRIFTRLREQSAGVMRKRGIQVDTSEDVDDTIPIAAFQRVMGRLFYVLRDPEGFDAAAYDQNHNSCVGWGEFTQVWKDRQIKLQLSLAERIYITCDDPQSCHMAKIVSIVTLSTIVVSSVGFILSTVPEFQDRSIDGLEEPKPRPAFELMENCCLFIFVVEYLVRICSCPAVRGEVADKDMLTEIATGYEKIYLTTPADRIFRFVTSPANIIDLAAILPGVVTIVYWVFTQKSLGNGGGFVVLRLVRLTKIFRAFRIGKYVDTVVIMWRTVKQSTKALYVLGFNLLLGVVIFGSLMYLLEQGTWDVEVRAYRRIVDRQWNATLNEYTDIYGPSPWHSIPRSFWWAIVTSTGVGFGDHIPSTPNGKIVATICMVWSLVILALPIGVMGGTFSRVWHEFSKNKETESACLRREMVHVAAAVQRMQPHKVSRLVMLEVWSDDGADESCMPMNPEGFMGTAKLELELMQDQPVSREVKLRLSSDGGKCKREVSGFISVRYDWVPDTNPPPRPRQAKGVVAFAKKLLLHGTLRFELIGASKLLNTDWSHPSVKASPFVVMLCYPNSPATDAADTRVKPVVWRSPVAAGSLNPRWDVARTFPYLWYAQEDAQDSPGLAPRSDSSSPIRRDSSRRLTIQDPTRLATSLSMLTSDLPSVAGGMEKLSQELQRLTLRVDQLQNQTSYHLASEDSAEMRPSQGSSGAHDG